MKIKYRSFKLLLLLPLLLIVVNCQEDEHSVEHIHSIDEKIIKKPFSEFDNLPRLIELAMPEYKTKNKKAKDSIDIYDFEIDSSSVTKVISGKDSYYTMNITRKVNFEYNVFENLVICDKGGEQEAYLMVYMPDAEYYERIKTNEHAGYKGGVTAYKLDASRFAKSRRCSDVSITYCNYTPDGNTDEVHVAGPNCTRIVYTLTITLCTETPTYFATKPLDLTFVNISPASGGGGKGGAIKGVGTSYNPFIPGDSGVGGYNPVNPVNPGFGTANGNPTVLTGPLLPSKGKNAQMTEDQIITDGLDKCSAGVLEELKKLKDKDIAKIITKLDGNPSPYKLRVIKEAFETNSGAPAYTSRTHGVLSYDYTVRLHPDYLLTANKLSIAGTLIHEIIHGYFLSLIDDKGDGDPNAIHEMSELFDAYVTKTFGPSSEMIHHQVMALKYVDVIGRALQEYNTGWVVPDGVVPDQIYTDIAWGGLIHAPVYRELPEVERKRIEARFAAEWLNMTRTEQEPAGQPCK